MQIVSSLTDPTQAAAAQAQGARIIELRFDLMDGDPVDMVRQCRKACPLPVIATFRSAQEGGQYFGSPEEWAKKIAPVIPLVDYVDIEQQFARQAAPVKEAGKTIIASHHSAQMMPLHILFVLEQELDRTATSRKLLSPRITRTTSSTLLPLPVRQKNRSAPGSWGHRSGMPGRSSRSLARSSCTAIRVCRPQTGQYSVEEFVALKKLLF